MNHKRLSPGEPTALSRANLMHQAHSELGDSGRWLWVRFASGESKRVFEVAVEDGQVLLNIPHDEKGGLLPKLQPVGLNFPEWWKVRKDKSKGLLSNGFLEIEASRSDEDAIVVFIGRLGKELLGWKDDEMLSACLQR